MVTTARAAVVVILLITAAATSTTTAPASPVSTGATTTTTSMIIVKVEVTLERKNEGMQLKVVPALRGDYVERYYPMFTYVVKPHYAYPYTACEDLSALVAEADSSSCAMQALTTKN
jgi:hypothetical protein